MLIGTLLKQFYSIQEFHALHCVLTAVGRDIYNTLLIFKLLVFSGSENIHQSGRKCDVRRENFCHQSSTNQIAVPSLSALKVSSNPENRTHKRRFFEYNTHKVVTNTVFYNFVTETFKNVKSGCRRYLKTLMTDL